MSAKLTNRFRLKDSGAVLIEGGVGNGGVLLLRHLASSSAKASGRPIICIQCLRRKLLRFHGVDPDQLRRIPGAGVGLAEDPNAAPLFQSLGLQELFTSVHISDGVVIIDSLNVLLALYGLAKTLALIHHLVSEFSCRVVSLLVTSGVASADIAVLEHYSESVLRLDESMSDSVLSSAEETLRVDWSRKSRSTGSVVRGMEAITLIVKTAEVVRREQVESFVDLPPNPVSPATTTASSLSLKPLLVKAEDDAMSSLTTFKLSLSDQEKAARSEVDLPYLKSYASPGDAPVFASPCVCGDAAVCASVDGSLFALDCRTGRLLWRTLSCEEHRIFSSPAAVGDGGRCGVVVGTHGSAVRRYDFGSDGEAPELSWSAATSSEVFAVPCCADAVFERTSPPRGEEEGGRRKRTRLRVAVVASTDGVVAVLSAGDGVSLASLRLPGPVFSSPAVWDEWIVVGCRDNNVYGICVD